MFQYRSFAEIAIGVILVALTWAALPSPSDTLVLTSALNTSQLLPSVCALSSMSTANHVLLPSVACPVDDSSIHTVFDEAAAATNLNNRTTFVGILDDTVEKLVLLVEETDYVSKMELIQLLLHLRRLMHRTLCELREFEDSVGYSAGRVNMALNASKPQSQVEKGEANWLCCFLPHVCPAPWPRHNPFGQLHLLIHHTELSLVLEILDNLRGTLFDVEEIWSEFDKQTHQFSSITTTGIRTAFKNATSVITTFLIFSTNLDIRLSTIEQRLTSTVEMIEGLL